MGHARSLLPLDEENQIFVANEVIKRSLSVRQTEALVKKVLNPKPKKVLDIDPFIQDLSATLSKKLNSKIEIKDIDNKGRIIIHYKSKSELNDIVKHFN
jgi:ParB family chromosome partitioning protein